MPKDQLSRVPWPGNLWMPFIFQPALPAFQQPHKHSHSLQLATHTELACHYIQYAETPTSVSKEWWDLPKINPYKIVAALVYEFWDWDWVASQWGLTGLYYSYPEPQYTVRDSWVKFMSQRLQITGRSDSDDRSAKSIKLVNTRSDSCT